jgi:hypothetical protein
VVSDKGRDKKHRGPAAWPEARAWRQTIVQRRSPDIEPSQDAKSSASHWQHGVRADSVRPPSRLTRSRPYRENAQMSFHQLSCNQTVGLALGAALLFCSSSLNLAHAKPFMIVGNDEKQLWDDDGKAVLSAPGKDSVLIVDLADPEDPKIVATLPLKNSVVGPPVNVDIDPTGSVALVADSVDVIKDGEALKQVPDNKIYVIDLKANPPKLAATITGGKQPSGLNFSPDGKMALVANPRRQFDQRALGQRH